VRRFRFARLVLCAGLLLAAGARAQVVPDTAASKPPAPPRPSVVVDSAGPDGRTPGGALRRSLLIPGWGQVYNRQPLKAPVVAGAVVGLAGFAVYLHTQYGQYRRAYLYVVSEPTPDPDPATPDPGNPHAAYFDDWVAAGALSAPSTRTLRERTRRNRDLAILGTGLAYALQALDAYVYAHLAGFDVGEDLSLRAVPTPDGPALTLRVVF